MKIISLLIIIIWTVTSIYFGLGSMVYQNAKDTYENYKKKPQELADTIPVMANGEIYANKRIEMLNTLIMYRVNLEQKFFWVQSVPESINFLIGSSSFCVLGLIIGTLKRKVIDQEEIEFEYVLLGPILGLLTGFIILSISIVLPGFLSQDNSKPNPLSLLMISLLVGFFIKEFYLKITNYFPNKITKS